MPVCAAADHESMKPKQLQIHCQMQVRNLKAALFACHTQLLKACCYWGGAMRSDQGRQALLSSQYVISCIPPLASQMYDPVRDGCWAPAAVWGALTVGFITAVHYCQLLRSAYHHPAVTAALVSVSLFTLQA